MSTVGWTQAVNASSVLDKIQQTQQSQEELAQVQAKAKALQEERLRRTTVNNTPDSEKVRLREERDRKREERQKKGQNESKEVYPDENATSQGDDGEDRRKIDITV